MVFTKHLRDENDFTNQIGDFHGDIGDSKEVYYVNEEKNKIKINSFTVFFRLSSLEADSYGLKERLQKGYNICVTNYKGVKTYIFDQDKPIKVNEDLFKYGFEFNTVNLSYNTGSEKSKKMNYKIFTFKKRFDEPIILKTGESISVLLRDDFTYLHEHKFLIDYTV